MLLAVRMNLDPHVMDVHLLDKALSLAIFSVAICQVPDQYQGIISINYSHSFFSGADSIVCMPDDLLNIIGVYRIINGDDNSSDCH